jgi:hypothetical protein
MAKLTSEIIDEIVASFERAGGAAYLDELALRDPPTYCRLLSRVMPVEINANVQASEPLDLNKAMAMANARLSSAGEIDDQD